MARPDWDDYFMTLAVMAATRATCPRRSVGAVLVQGKDVRGTGYNGAPSGTPSCDDAGCLLIEGHCKRTVHAETNVLLRTDAQDRVGATMYVTDQPCLACANMIAGSGVVRVVYDRPYRATADHVEDLLRISGVTMERFTSRHTPNGIGLARRVRDLVI